MTRRAAVRGAVAILLAACASGAAAVSCSVETPGLSFGNYNPFQGAPNDSVGTILVSCSGAVGSQVAYLVRIGPGSSGTPNARMMRSPSGRTLGYNLYTDAARSLVWGDGTGGTQTLSDALTLNGVGQTRRFSVFGRTFERQNVSPGVYTDNLVISVEF